MKDENSQTLCQEVERVIGRKMKTPKDFLLLEENVQERTGERLSPTTLKRLWGYLRAENVVPRALTLDVLSRYVGYADYEAFCHQQSYRTVVQSDPAVVRRLSARETKVGQLVRLTWLPDRDCTVRYCGDGNWEVVKSVNTKLTLGTTFTCHLFIEREPLWLDNTLIPGSRAAGIFVCGRNDGVVWELIN